MTTHRDSSFALVALIAAQSLCAVFFLWDVLEDGLPLGLAAFHDAHFDVELAATLALIGGVAFELHYLSRLLRRKAHLERQVSVAAGALQDIMEENFRRWGLTPSEQDVAMFMIKGCAIAEIAQLRGCAEGTVKSHLNAIYRKAGVSGRGQLLSLLIEEIMPGPQTAPDPQAEALPGTAAPERA